MFERHSPAIVALLRERGLLAAAEAEALLDEQRATGKPAADLAIARGLIDRPRLLAAVAESLGVEFAENVPGRLAPELVAEIPADKARAFGVVPWRAGRSGLDVLCLDPFALQDTDDLGFALGRPVRLVVGDPARIEALLTSHYAEDEAGLAAVLAGLKTEDLMVNAAASAAELETLAGQSPIIRLVNLVLAQAVRDRASDVHFEPFENNFRVRSRVDGVLREVVPVPRALALPVTARLKVIANLNVAERRLPQDGRIQLTIGGRPVDLRISTLPTQFGESVVLRVLDQSAVALDLAHLAMPEPVRRGVEAVIQRPNGIFVVTGPTGSGKTTTLYSCLREIHRPESKVLTAEDPVEFEIEGIMQVPVNPVAGLTFAAALRAFLRQDPDVIMVGEIRDTETAQIAIQAALTGHLVLSTLHTNDAPGTITRLVDMGIEPFLIASTLEAVLAQRLVRRICPGCREPVALPAELLAQLRISGREEDARSCQRGRGCDRCGGSGYKGRLGIFELLTMTEALRELITARAPTFRLREQALADGMVSLREAGLAAVRAGLTTAEEILRYT